MVKGPRNQNTGTQQLSKNCHNIISHSTIGHCRPNIFLIKRIEITVSHYRACIFITILSLHFSMTCMEYKHEAAADVQDLTVNHYSVSIQILLINTKICCWMRITNLVVIAVSMRLNRHAKSLSLVLFVCQYHFAHRKRMLSMSLQL